MNPKDITVLGIYYFLITHIYKHQNNSCRMSTTNKTNNSIAYRAIALDLDGTLTNHDKEVTPITRQALMKAQKNGAHIILASGRPTYGIAPIADHLEINKYDGYVLSYNGGKIVKWQTKEEIYSNHLPNDVIPILYNYAKEKSHALLGYSGKEIITEMPDDKYVKEESRINKMQIRKINNLMESLEPNPTKLLMTGDPSLMIKAEEEMRQTNKDSNVSWLFLASIDDAAGLLASKDSALVIFNFSHFFACIDVETAETLASKIKNMMTTNADNDYMVVVQQSTDDDKLRSYRVFSKVLLSK